VSTEIHQCQECVDLLGEFLDGSLPPERAAALETHLSLCMPCVTFLRTYRETSRVARRSLAEEMPPELGESLHSFLEGAIPGFACKKGTCGDSALESDKT
jgi:hypothetical protein